MALAFVKSAGNTTSGTSLTATFAAAGTATAGNLLVACGLANSTLANFNDPAGWTLAVGDQDDSNAAAAKIWYKTAAGGETGVTITATSGTMGLQVMEFSGAGAWFLDKTASNDPVGNGTTCATGSTGTLTTAAEIAVAFIGGVLNTPTSPSWDTGFTTVATGSGPTVAGYLVTAATTALNPTLTWTGSNGRTGLIATFYGQSIVAQTFTGKLNVNATIAKTVTGLLNVGGRIVKTVTGLLNVRGPVPTGWTVRTEADWTGDPLTRPADIDYADLADVSDGTATLDIKRGTHILSAGMETGTSNGRVDNSGRNLDPSNVASPLYPNVKPRKRMRHIVHAGGSDYTLHTGFAERFPIDWSREVGTVNITTQDQLGLTATAMLPASVLDVVTAELGALGHWPMAESVFTGTAVDIIGTQDGEYIGNVQPGQQIVPYDSRPCPKFPAPQVDGLVTPAMRVLNFSCPQQASFSTWFRWDPATASTARPPIIMLQNVDDPDIPSGGFTSPSSVLVYLVNDTTLTYRQQFRLIVTNGSQQARLGAPVAFQLLDGATHHLVFSFDAAAKTFAVTCDGTRVTAFTDTGDGGTTALSSVNMSAVVSSLTTLSVGWGLDYQIPVVTPISAEVGHLAYWNSVLASGDVDELNDAGNVAWDGDTTAERLTRVLDLLGIDAADRNTFHGSQICGGTLLGQQNYQSYVKKILATELSELFIDADGKWTFPERADYGTPVHIFTDNPTADASLIPGVEVSTYHAVTPDYSYDRIVNDIIVSRENGADQEVTDATSIADYGEIAGTKYRTGQSGPVGKLDTLHQTATAARDSAQWLIDRHKDPVTYIAAVTVDSIDRTVSLSTMVGIEIGDTVVVRARPAGGGSPISLICQVEAVQHRFSGYGKWTATYSLTDGTAYP